MPAPRSKLVLPTVATCRWRHAPTGGAPTECGLVASLLGEAAEGPAAVSDEACAACCRSFPPSGRTLNPVVAGLLHAAATRALGRPDGAVAGPGRAAATRARALAEAALDVDLPARSRLTPARGVVPCAWRGALKPSPDPDPAPPGDPTTAADEPHHHCDHADHDVASPERCRICRDWSRRRPISRPMTLAELVPPPERRSGRAVRDWAVGVTTAPRRQATLEACLDGIVRAGWGTPRLFLDGTTRVPSRHAHLPTTWREEGIGAWPSWFLALTELLVQRPDADAYLMLQDDVALHEREPLRAALERILWPGDRPGLVLLFYPGPGTTPGWHSGADPWHLSAQALLFPPDLARALVTDPRVVRAVLDSPPGHHTPIPDVINDWVRRQAVDCWYPTPSLAQHVGNASAIWDHADLSGRRRAAWFTGSLEDAFALEEDLADFPEDAFPAATPHRDAYRRQIERGRERMRATSVVVGGVCRNVRHLLPRLAARVERLGARFGAYRVVLIADDSTDRTREFLDDWQAANPRVTILDRPPGPRGAGWMARCRDHAREQIITEFAQFDHAIVVDTDLPGGWSGDGIAHTFGADDWDFVGALGLILGPVATHGSAPWLRFDQPGEPAQRGGPLVPVGSCFGGLGVYRMACLRAARYVGDTGSEHHGFHAHLRRSGLGRLFENPNQIVLHSPA